MRRGLLLGVLGSILVLVGWWFLFISPRNADIAQAEDQLAAAQQQEQRLRSQIVGLEEIRSNEILYIDAISELQRLIPERPLLEEFIVQIDDLSRTNGVELITLAPSLPRPDEESDLREIALSAQIQGEFFEIMGFLFGLADMERLVRVDGIALSSTEIDGITELAVSLDLRLFTLSDLLPIDIELPGTENPTTTTTTAPTDGGVEASGEGE
jgi:Tfp pilus assembly protein PilO